MSKSAELNRQYSPSRLADLDRELARYAEASARARVAVPGREFAYGPDAVELLDFFPAPTAGTPLVAFVHGGYWQELDKADASFPAPGFVERDISYAAIGYGLAPAHRMDRIVAMVRRAVLWLHDHADALGYRRGELYLAGSSAGAHLVAMCLLPGWLPNGLSVSEVIRGAVLLSGVYDLTPLRRTYVNDVLGMVSAEAERNSPQRHLPAALPPLVVARGERETPEFARQQREFVLAARAGGTETTELVATGRNHFDICFDIADPATVVGGAVAALIDRTRSPRRDMGGDQSDERS